MTKTYAQSPESWVKFEKGKCEGCWAACCTLPVEAYASDLERLGLATVDECNFDPEEVAYRLIKRRIVEYYEPKRGVFMIAQEAGRDCIFLHPTTRRCTVYELRPDVCRRFPRVGPRPGFCPHRDIQG